MAPVSALQRHRSPRGNRHDGSDGDAQPHRCPAKVQSASAAQARHRAHGDRHEHVHASNRRAAFPAGTANLPQQKPTAAAAKSAEESRAICSWGQILAEAFASGASRVHALTQAKFAP